MKKSDFSKKSMKFFGNEGKSGKDKQRLDCYNKSLDDAWDMKSETMCSTVCGF